MSEQTGRTIGIRHRTKMTVEEESRPTEVVVLEGGEVSATYKLEDEQAELDFLLSTFPTSWRVPQSDDNLAAIPKSHLKMRRLKKGEEAPPDLLYIVDSERYQITRAAEAFDGLKVGDTVAMILGGSGDYFAYALARRGKEVGAKVLRIPAHVLKKKRQDREKSEDAQLLAELVQSKRGLFYEMQPRDFEIIELREKFRARIEAMKARIACEQRLRQRFIGSIFCRADGYFPEGAVEKLFDEAKANDAVYQALLMEETARERELEKSLKHSAVWKSVFDQVEGMGWSIASRIVAGVVDIRRFRTDAQFKAFCGVHVLQDGRFPRRRSKEVANWHPDLRQALYLFGDQMNRRQDSIWGRKLLAYKKKLREVHPEPVVGENGKKKYTNGHIHKMATWRTLTKFAEWLFHEWKKLEREAAAEPLRKAA